MNHGLNSHSVVAIFHSHSDAEAGVDTLKRVGIDMRRVSIVARDFHTEEQAVGFYTCGNQFKFWGERGAFWGRLWAMLSGGAFFYIPTVGPLVVMGPLVEWIAQVLEIGALGDGTAALAGAFRNLGIPNESIASYETAVKTGKFLVLARGSAELSGRVRAALSTASVLELTAHEL